MKKYVLMSLIFVVGLKVNAQITTTICPNGEGFKEFPMLYKVNNEDIPIYKMPAFNLDSVLQYEYDLDIKGVGRPYRFGYAFDVNYGMEHGKGTTLEDKNIGSIRFRSDMAYTLNFRFADLKLSGNAEMYVYNSTGTVVDGPYTYKNNADEEFRSISSDLVDGDEIIIQIIEPKESKQSSSVKIARVVHGFIDHYREILPNKNKRGESFQGATLNCHIDVSCYPKFDTESRGIVRIMLDSNNYWCSGALLNNQSGTNRPYFLTAHHCADRNKNDALSAAEISNAESWFFQFNYKTSSCNGTNVVGYVNRYEHAYFIASNGETDFLLLELEDAVTDPNIRFLGGDALPMPISGISSGFGIHHPNGDLMKIVFDNSGIDLWPLPKGGIDHPNNSPARTHLYFFCDDGMTEGGSSGSPLFDQNRRVRGQLHGGYDDDCDPGKILQQYEYYGSLAVSMGKGLFDWLIPYPTGNLDDFVCNTAGPCQSITFENKTLTEDERIVCKNIILQNITINSGATLLLQATESITLSPNVVLKTGGTLITEGRLLINSMYTVEAGANFIVK